MRAALSCSLAAITALGSGWFNDAKFDLLTAGADFNNDRYFLPALGSELVTNGTFDTDISGWEVKFDGTISWQATGRLRVTSNGGSLTARGLYTLSGLTIGKLYAVPYSIVAQSTPFNWLVFIGIASTGSTTGAVAQAIGATYPSSGTIYFTATQTTHYLGLMHNSATPGSYTEFDNVSVKEVILDASGRTYGSELIVNGGFSTATGWTLKSPAVGTETMVISGGILSLKGDGTNQAYADQSFATVNGQLYEFAITTTGTGGVQIGASQGSSTIFGGAIPDGQNRFKFVATSGTTWIRLFKTAAATATFDDVSVKALTAFGKYPKRSATFNEWFAFTASSTTARSYTDANGTIKNDLTADAPRFTWANGKRQFRLEDQRTNSIRNNTMQGVVAGNPGSMPTNWAAFPNNGLSRDVIGTGVENGREYVEIRYFGTPSATGSFDIVFDNANTIAAANGQTWTLSTYTKLTGGSVTNLSPVTLYLFEYDGASAFLATSGQSFTPGIFTRTSHTRTLTGATTAFIRGLIKFNYTSGQAIDITLRVYRPQLEQGAFASDDIPTGGSAVTRTIETARLSPLLEAILQRSAGSVVVRGDLSGDTQTNRRLVGANGSISLIQTRAADLTTVAAYNGTTALAATLGSGNANSPLGAALAFDAAGRAICGNGGTVATDANTIGAITAAYLGRSATVGAGEYGDGFFDFVGISPEKLSNSNLQSMAVAA